jgi:hypothetical protein
MQSQPSSAFSALVDALGVLFDSRTLIRKHVDAAQSLFALADVGIATVGACDTAAS